MHEYELAAGAEDDLESIADYTTARWGAGQSRRYAPSLAGHFDALANGEARTKTAFEDWPQLRASRCEHHVVFSVRRGRRKLTILAVLHENMDLLTRLRERLDPGPS